MRPAEPSFDERRAPFVALELDRVRDRLETLAGVRRVKTATPLTSGLCNSNYRLDFEDGGRPLVLRLYTSDASACLRECRVHALVAGSVPVPAFVRAEAGSDLLGFPFALLEWVDGAHLGCWQKIATPEEMEAVARELGRIAAAIGGFRFDFAGFFDSELRPTFRFDNVVDGYLDHMEEGLLRGRAGQRLGEATTQQVWSFVQQHRAALDAVKGDQRLAHGDYGPWNILLTRGDRGVRVSGVLDWEFAHAGTPLADFGNLLRRGELLPPGFAARFAAGYEAVAGPLPSDWRLQSTLLDMVSLCDFLTSPLERPRLYADVTARLRAIVQEPGR